MALLRLYLCGELAIEHAGGLVRERDLPGPQGRCLWAYLVVERGRPLGRDELANALWGDEVPDAWDTSLNAIASRLRRALRPAAEVALRGESGRYTLRLPRDTFVDFERAWRALLRAEAALREHDHGAAVAEGLVARGIAVRGFLPGEAGGWVEARRRALAETLLQATELTGEAELARGWTTEAQRLAREVIELDPLHESGYRLLMRALAASGNGAQVIRVMQECRGALRAAVGAAPSSETERVFRQAIGART